MRTTTYRGYRIEPDAQGNRRVIQPNGERWIDAAVNLKTAKAWIDWEIFARRESEAKWAARDAWRKRCADAALRKAGALD